jgi:hypothetical protein
MFRHQNARKNHNIKIANKFSEKVGKLIYLGRIPTNRNGIQVEIKMRLNTGNACCSSVL